MPAFLFDLDETLITARPDYERAKYRFAHWLFQEFGEDAPPLHTVVNTHDECSRSLATSLGYARERFPLSFQHAYRRLANQFDLPVTAEALDTVYEFGLLAYRSPETYRDRGFLPGAKETLDFLQQQGDPLVLYTQGVPSVQNPKIEGLNLEQWFDDIHIVEEKDRGTLEQVLTAADMEPAETFLVEDKTENVRVALQLGVGGIHIPAITTFEHREENPLPDNHPRLHTFNKIDELVEHYEQLHAV